MKRLGAQPIMIVIALLAVVGCQHGRNVEVARVETDPKVAEIRGLLVACPPVSLLPELDAVSPASLAAGDVGVSLLAWVRGAAATAAIPETTYTLYRRFKTAGERPPYEGPYFAKRNLLTQEVVAAWLGQDDSRIPRINDLIWNICEETTWVAPAHENDSWTIDLFSAETAADLAQVLLVLGDRLPEEIRERVRAEIKKRILDPYLEHGNQYWWTGGTNNWTGVCAGSVGQAFLLIEDDVDRQAQALALVLEQLGRFIEHAFEPDGGCLEGIGYWNYGLSQYISFAEMLRVRTGGAIDLLADEKVKAIARYPLAVFLGNDRYASFSDAHDTASVDPFIGARLAERAAAPALLGLIGGTTDWRFSTVLRNLLWWDGNSVAAPPLEDALLPVSGVAKLVGQCGDTPVVLVIKAGHNAEPHNHNDVGSFVLSAGGTIYLCDPGAGLYNAEYFSGKRYDNVFANSYGHSVPRIGEDLQMYGREHKGQLDKTGDKTVSVEFQQAYKNPAIEKATRTVTLKDNVVTLEDSFQFAATGMPVEEAFMTWQKAEVNGNTARIIADNGVVEIQAAEGVFTTEPLEEACKANHKSGVLTRLAVAYPASAQKTAGFTITYQPAR